MRSASERIHRALRVLLFSTVFPNGPQPHHGVFVRERMRGLPADVEVRVVAPAPWFPLVAGLRPGYRPPIAREEIHGGVQVLHPRFVSFPGFLKFLDGFLMFLWHAARPDAAAPRVPLPGDRRPLRLSRGAGRGARRARPARAGDDHAARDAAAARRFPAAPAAAPLRPAPGGAGDRRLGIAESRRGRPRHSGGEGAGDRERDRSRALPAASTAPRRAAPWGFPSTGRCWSRWARSPSARGSTW